MKKEVKNAESCFTPLIWAKFELPKPKGLSLQPNYEAAAV